MKQQGTIALLTRQVNALVARRHCLMGSQNTVCNILNMAQQSQPGDTIVSGYMAVNSNLTNIQKERRDTKTSELL